MRVLSNELSNELPNKVSMMKMPRFLGAWLCVVVLALVSGCASVQTTQPGVVGVTRTQSVSPLVSRDDLSKQASSLYAQTLGEASEQSALNTDPAMTKRVRAIAERLIEQTTVFREDAHQWKWEVNVIQSKELNAWCMPGGKIAVYSGLIDQLKLSDDELAAVMGHEIAHALREHSLEKASEAANVNVGMNVLGTVLGAVTGYGGLITSASGMAYQLAFQLPNSRELETEADRIGVELSARAGYDPEAAVTLWEKMGAASKSGTPSFLSTHPSSADRQADLRKYAEMVMPLYEEAQAERVNKNRKTQPASTSPPPTKNQSSKK